MKIHGMVLAAALTAAFASVPAAAQDTVKLKNGATMTGKVVEETDTVVILQSAGGLLTFPRAEVKSVTRQNAPPAAAPTPGPETPGTEPVEPGEAPAAPSAPATEADLLGYLLLPNPEAAIRDAETLAASFQPGQVQPGMIKGQLGAMLGDPELKNIDLTKPVLVALYRPGAGADPAMGMIPRAAAVISAKDPAALAAVLATRGMEGKAGNGVLAVGFPPDGASAAGAASAAYGAFAAGAAKAGAGMPNGDLRLHLKVDRLLAAYGQPLEEAVDGLAGLLEGAMPPKGEKNPFGLSGEGLASLLMLEFKGILSSLRQTASLQIDLDLRGTAIASEVRIEAKAGTALADLLSMPAPGPNRALALPSGAGGFLAMGSQLDAKRISAFIGQILDELAKDPVTAETLTPELKAELMSGIDLLGGDNAVVLRPAAGKPMGMDGAMVVKDEAEMMALVEKVAILLSPEGALGSMYANLGVPMEVKIEKGVRTHAGAAVHRYKMNVDLKDAPPEQAEAMKAMMMSEFEFAFAGGFYLVSADSASLDAMIDRAKAPPAGKGLELKSAAAFGPGRHMYVDYDVLGLLKSMSSLPGMEEMGKAFAEIPGGDPMLFAATLTDGTLRFESLVSLEPFLLMAKKQMGARREAPMGRAGDAAAVGGLRNLVSTEAAWRQLDMDGNALPDYWTGDVFGLYGCADGAGNATKAIDQALAKADRFPGKAAGAAEPRPFYAAQPPAAPEPKGGYVFEALVNDAEGAPYAEDGADDDEKACENTAKFGFRAIPAVYGKTGTMTYQINEEGVIYGKDLGYGADTNPPQGDWEGGEDPTTEGWRVVQ